MLLLYKKFHMVVSILHGIQQNDFRILARLVLVVNADLPKIAHYDVAGHLVQWHVVGVSFRRLVRGEHYPAGLRLRLREVMRHAFLLGQHPCFRQVRVDIFPLSVHKDRALKLDVLQGIYHAVDSLQEGQPEALTVLLFAAFSAPLVDEFSRGFPSFTRLSLVFPSFLVRSVRCPDSVMQSLQTHKKRPPILVYYILRAVVYPD